MSPILIDDILEQIVQLAIDMDHEESKYSRCLPLSGTCKSYRARLSPLLFKTLVLHSQTAVSASKFWQRVQFYARYCAASLNRHVRRVSLKVMTECSAYSSPDGDFIEYPTILRQCLRGITHLDRLDVQFEAGSTVWPQDSLSSDDFAAILEAIAGSKRIENVTLKNLDGSCYRFGSAAWVTLLGDTNARQLSTRGFMPGGTDNGAFDFRQLTSLRTFEARDTILPSGGGLPRLTSLRLCSAFTNDIVALDLLLLDLAPTLTSLRLTSNRVWLRAGYAWRSTLHRLETLTIGHNHVGSQNERRFTDMGLLRALTEDTALKRLALDDSETLAMQSFGTILPDTLAGLTHVFFADVAAEKRNVILATVPGANFTLVQDWREWEALAA